MRTSNGRDEPAICVEEGDMPGTLTFTSPHRREVTLREHPGRGRRCCAASDAPHYDLPLDPSLRAVLTEAVPGPAQDDPWLVPSLCRLAPQEILA